MIKTKQFKSLIALLLAALMMVSAAACGMNNDSKDGSKGKKTEAQSSMTDGEPKSPEEAAAMYKKLMEEEKAILDENPALWEKVFMAADKGMVLIEDGKNYGEFLLDTIESAKDQFTADELKLLKADAEKIRAIEMKLTKLVNKYPELSDKDGNGGANMPEESAVPSDKPSSGNKGGSGNTDKPSSGNKGGSGSTGSGAGNHNGSSSGNAPLFFQELDEVGGFQNGQGAEFFSDFVNISHCIVFFFGSSRAKSHLAFQFSGRSSDKEPLGEVRPGFHAFWLKCNRAVRSRG